MDNQHWSFEPYEFPGTRTQIKKLTIGFLSTNVLVHFIDYFFKLN